MAATKAAILDRSEPYAKNTAREFRSNLATYASDIRFDWFGALKHGAMPKGGIVLCIRSFAARMMG